MAFLRKKHETWTHTIGAAVVMTAACVACCISLSVLGSVSAWFGIASLSAVTIGWNVGIAAAFTVGIAVFFFVHQRRRPGQRNSTCGCGTRCRT